MSLWPILAIYALHGGSALINESVAKRSPGAIRGSESFSRSHYNACIRDRCFFSVALALIFLSISACSHSPQKGQAQAGVGGWREFQGTWTAAGTRNTMQLDGGRHASIATFEGSLVLAGSQSPGVGFRSETILF